MIVCNGFISGAFFSGMTAIWAAALIIFLVVEAAAPGLVSIWFALGALAALISALLHAPLWLQVAWFFVVSIAALALTRPLAKKYINARVQPTNADRMLGKECIITEAVDNLHGTGAASVDGKVWTARSLDSDKVIPVGSVAIVERIEGVKLIVK